MISIYIYSKDRPAQLDLLLRSIGIEYTSIHVLYKYTTEEFKQGYDKLISRFPNTYMHQEMDFQKDVIYMLNTMITKYALGLSDDCCFIDKPNLDNIDKLLNNEEIHGLNLHLNNKYDACYTSDKIKDVTIPEFITKGEFLIWEWKQNLQNSTWGYPFGVEGNIVRRQDYLKICQERLYKNPNEMESAHTTMPDLFRSQMACYKTTQLLNIPINRVQNVFKNKCGVKHHYTPEELNTAYLEGKRIKRDFDQNTNDFYQEIEVHYD